MRSVDGFQTVDEITQADLKLKPEGKLFDFADIHIAEHQPDLLKHDVYLAQKRVQNRLVLGGDVLNAESLSPFPKQPRLTLTQIEGEIDAVIKELIKPCGEQIDAVVWGNHEERLFRNEKSSVDVLSGHLSIGSEITRVNPETTIADLGRGIRINLTCGSQIYRLYMAHGRGHSRYMYWTEFDRARSLFPGMDVYLLHHSHQYNHQIQRWINPDKTLGRALYIRGGAYTPYLPYQEKMLLPPSDVGAVVLQFHPRKHRVHIDFTR